MSTWKKVLTLVSSNVESKFDELALRLRQRLNLDKELQILPYIGYATAETLRLRGRVLRHKNIAPSTDKDSLWENMTAAYQHLESDEIPYAVVRASYGDGEVSGEFKADDEGYFLVELPIHTQPTERWVEVRLELVSAPVNFEGDVVAHGRVLVPSTQATFGLISDIDDTVLQSSATNYLKAARLMFLQNAKTRLPFDGVATLYQQLQKGGAGTAENPVFYVSSSPWNLFPLLTEFFELQSLPLGPLFLKDYGISPKQFITSGHGAHKLAQIEEILTAYPDLSFILMGDSGQKDPEIYRTAVETHPGRIAAVYIRDVTDDKRDAEVHQLAKVCATAGVDMLLVADSYEVGVHAAAHGFMPADGLDAILEDMKRSAEEPSELEVALGEEG